MCFSSPYEDDHGCRENPQDRRINICPGGRVEKVIGEDDHEVEQDDRQRAAIGVVEDPGHDDRQRNDPGHKSPEPHRPGSLIVLVGTFDEEQGPMPYRPHNAQNQTGFQGGPLFLQAIQDIATPAKFLGERS